MKFHISLHSLNKKHVLLAHTPFHIKSENNTLFARAIWKTCYCFNIRAGFLMFPWPHLHVSDWNKITPSILTQNYHFQSTSTWERKLSRVFQRIIPVVLNTVERTQVLRKTTKVKHRPFIILLSVTLKCAGLIFFQAYLQRLKLLWRTLNRHQSIS